VENPVEHAGRSYWDHHFLPGVPTQRAWPKKPGSSFVDAIIINAVVPYLATMAHCSNEHALMSRALAMLESCPAEDNRIIRLWTAAGIQPANAAESQGMMELYQSYCSRHRCLQCRIGYLLLHQQDRKVQLLSRAFFVNGWNKL
jgi:hypothetical protein